MRKKNVEDVQFPQRQHGYPSCLQRLQDINLTNPPMHHISFSHSMSPFHFCFPAQQHVFVTGRIFTVCSVSVPDTVNCFYFTFFLSVFLLTMSRLCLWAQKFSKGRMPRRDAMAGIMLQLQPLRQIAYEIAMRTNTWGWCCHNSATSKFSMILKNIDSPYFW